MHDYKTIKEKIRKELESHKEMVKYTFSKIVTFYNYRGESPVYIYNSLTGEISEKINKEEILIICMMPASVRYIYHMFYTREAAEEYKWLFELIDGWVEYSIQTDIERWTKNYVPIDNLYAGDTFFSTKTPLFVNDMMNAYSQENKYKGVCTNDNDLKKVKEVKLCAN